MKTGGYLSLLLILLFAVFLCGCVAEDGNTGKTTDQNGIVSENEELIIYCGAGMKKPMEDIGKGFTEKTGIPVTYNYAGSGQLLAQMELSQKGDIYMPGATTDFEVAKEKGYILDEALVAYHVPVIATPKGNPAGINSLEDMGKAGVRVSMGEPDSMALGIIAKKIFEKNGVKDKILPNVVVERATVNEIVTDIVLENADAAIIWEDLYNPEKMDVVYIPEKDNLIKIIPIGSLSFSKNPDSAKEFVEYVSSSNGGKAIFKNCGFTPYNDEKTDN